MWYYKPKKREYLTKGEHFERIIRILRTINTTSKRVNSIIEDDIKFLQAELERLKRWSETQRQHERNYIRKRRLDPEKIKLHEERYEKVFKLIDKQTRYYAASEYRFMYQAEYREDIEPKILGKIAGALARDGKILRMKSANPYLPPVYRGKPKEVEI